MGLRVPLEQIGEGQSGVMLEVLGVRNRDVVIGCGNCLFV